MELLINVLSPITRQLGIPPELLPLALMRPMSGSASLGILAELLRTYGPDSFIGRTASTMMGSTETTFYTISIYLGSIGYKDARYILAAGLLADFTGFAVSLLICTLLFGR
jgi:spore maturation protein B